VALLGAIRVQQDFLSLTLSGKTGDRPRKFSYSCSEPGTVTAFLESFGNRWASGKTLGNREELRPDCCFDPFTGQFVGVMLWRSLLRDGGIADFTTVIGPYNGCYFTAGTQMGQHGLFGSLVPVDSD